MLCLIICVDYILLAFLDFFYPRHMIDLAPKFSLAKWKAVSAGEHAFVARPLTIWSIDLRRRGEQARRRVAINPLRLGGHICSSNLSLIASSHI